ncbi:phosphopantetheine-binding protein [Micromonospora sp. NPDC051196]|uniref:phosphopantetheine-binding protein n=1 Tax=Micromonospora sp. NPDC051196 TaxID=3155281 RepID=UPI00343EBCB2
MTGADWPDEFEKAVRQYLPMLEEEVVLTAESSLSAFGLDSLATVGLLVELEETFAVQFPDEDLAAETFASPGALWAVIERLREGPDHGR